MAIMVECSSCGKQYNAPDSMAGKRVRCKGCGQIFQIPSAENEMAPDDLSALSALDRSFHEGEPPAAGGQAEQYVPPGYGEGGGEEIPLGPSRAGRANIRFRYPFASEVDLFLPFFLVAIALGVAALATFKLDDIRQNWLSWIRFLVLVLCYVALIYPLSLQGVRMAGRRLGFQLPRTARWRAFATFMPAFAIGVLIWLSGGGDVPGLVLGSLAGLVISLGFMMLLFRLWPEEIGLSSLYVSIMYCFGVAVAAGILLGLNVLLSNVLVATKKIASLPGSPFGMAFSWPSPAEQSGQVALTSIAPKFKPTDNAAKKPPSATSPARPDVFSGATPSPKPPPVAPAASADSNNPNSGPSVMFPAEPDSAAPNSSVASNTNPQPRPAPGDATAATPGTGAPPVIPGAGTPPSIPSTAVPEEPAAQLPPMQPSPLAPTIGVARIPPGFDEVIHPLTPSGWMAVARGSVEQNGKIERWSIPTQAGQTMEKSGVIPRTHDANVSDAYALSPDGELLARISSFPSLQLHVYSFSSGTLKQTPKLQEDPSVRSEVFGFASADRLLVRRTNDARRIDAFEIWDIRAGRMLRRVQVPPFDKTASSVAISPDGLTLAVAARGDSPQSPPDAQPILYLYDVSGQGGSGLRSKSAISELRAPGAVRPSGMAYSSDGTRLTLLFEEGRNGLMITYSITPGRLAMASQKVYAPMPVQPPAGWEGSSLVWVNSNALLLYGQILLDATTGDPIGSTGLSEITSQHFTRPDLCELVYRDPRSGQPAIALVKLNQEQIAELTKPKK
jgi:hypothetical protein